MANRVAIVGAGQTYHRSHRPDVTQMEMVNEAVRPALADAQLRMKDIDAVFVGNMEMFEGIYLPDHMMADFSGAYMKPGFKIASGGTTGCSILEEAFHCVTAGIFDVVLVTAFEKQDTGDSTAGITCATTPAWGKGQARGAIHEFAKQALSYIKHSGATEAHAAMVRLKADRGACRNPYSHLKLGLKSIDEILASPPLEYPLRLFDFCPQSCGACAIIIASEERARKITKKPVWIADTICVHQEIFRAGAFCDFTGKERYSQEIAAERLYKRNGITNPRKEIDMAEVYEPSDWEEMLLYELFGLCPRNEGWKMVEKGITEIEGAWPVNPSGGVLSTNPIGATPTIRIAECVLQIRGEAGEHQVTKDVKTAFATALGGPNWTSMILLKRNL
ncbi:MAG: thiolase family protein [Chloroflexi bacterium]|nr:thiolase family protein [Chloroflexota bacterium]